MVQLTPTPIALFPAVATVVSALLAWYVWNHQSGPGTTAFAAIFVGVTGWTAMDTINLVVVHQPTYFLRTALRWYIASVSAVTALIFAVQYTGWDELVSKWTIAALTVPPTITAVVILLGDPGSIWFGTCGTPPSSNPGLGASCQRGPLFTATMTYQYTVSATYLGLMTKAVISFGRPFSKGTLAFLVGAVAPLIASVSWFLGLVPIPGFDPTSAVFTVMGVAWGYAFLYSDFFDIVPAISRIGQRKAISDLREGVVIVNDQNRIISMNDAGAKMLACDPEEVVGDRIEDVVGDPSFTVEPGESTNEFETDEGRQTFEVAVSPLYHDQDQQIGHTLVFRNVTERLQRKQQLAALNRVLRHNLRNDMNIVKGYADTLSQRTDDPEAEMAEFIAEQSSELVEVGSKVRDMERIMDRRRSELQVVDLSELLHDIVEDVRSEHPDGDVELFLPDEVWIRSDDMILETIFRNIINNALEHNDAENPTVEISTMVGSSSWIEISVEDNGPGIPEQERAALREGRETDLQHGSGLGLWVVNWGITTLGGSLDIYDASSGGTVVRVRLPGLTDAPESETPEENTQEVGAGAD